MGSWWSDHPDLEGVARRGRGELQEESIAAEHDAELLRKRRRKLAAVCHEWMSRGDLVTIATAGHHFEGHLVAVVNDLLVITTKTLSVSISIASMQFARSDKRAVVEGTAGGITVSSFRAALGQYEIDSSLVRLVGVEGGFDLTGIIEASTDDHVLMRDNQGLEWALPRSQIAFAVGS
jgi:hypothetical protein